MHTGNLCYSKYDYEVTNTTFGSRSRGQKDLSPFPV
jgi:hypothetical protein